MRATASACALGLGLLLAGCSGTPKRDAPPPRASAEAPAAGVAGGGPRRARPDQPGEYTAGGLYRPGVADGGPAIPPDVSRLPEPVPQPEPRARYGNRSPYTVLGRSYHVMDSAAGYVQRGIASWYGEKFHGRATSSLEPYDMYAFSAAHKTLPLPTFARVTNLENGRSVVVRVNDRGPFHADRLIDLSYAAAVKLGVHARGTARVEVRALTPGETALARQESPRAQGDAGQIAAARRAPAAATAAAPTRGAHGAPARTWVQVGSFGNKDNAQRLRDRLRAAELAPVSLDRARAGEGRLWRVRLGPLDGRVLAEHLAARVRALGFGQPTLVHE
jgi:rare lipoprotein A